jgi:hypothetical protein
MTGIRSVGHHGFRVSNAIQLNHLVRDEIGQVLISGNTDYGNQIKTAADRIDLRSR